MHTHIAGIPCKIEVTYFFKQEPMGRNCDSDWDSRGYTEIEFNVLDRKGYKAPWLEKKMSPADQERINSEIEEAHEGAKYDE